MARPQMTKPPLSPSKQAAMDEVTSAVGVILAHVVAHSPSEAEAIEGLWALFKDMRSCLSSYYSERH